MTDPYFDTFNCIQRLYKQYLSTPRLLIAVDFDDTIFDFHKKGDTYPQVIETIKRCNQHNFYIIIFTASRNDRHDFIREYCESIGIKIDAINKNVIETPYGQEGAKIFYNLFLDDRAGLGQAHEILKKTLDLVDSFQKTQIK